jgi:hypothetical protein
LKFRAASSGVNSLEGVVERGGDIDIGVVAVMPLLREELSEDMSGLE